MHETTQHPPEPERRDTIGSSARPSYARSGLVLLGIGLLLAGLTVLGACTDDGPAGDRPGAQLGGRAAPTSAAASDPTDTERPAAPPESAADLEDVVAAYGTFWDVGQVVDRQPVQRWRPLLTAVATQPVLDELLEGLHRQRASGVLQYGTVEPHPTVAYLTADRASIVDCQDASRSGELDRDTGAIRTVGSPRTAVAAVLVLERPGVWKVSEARYLPDPC